MTFDVRRIRIDRFDAPDAQVEMARAAPAGPLRPYVREYVGWSDTSRAISRRRQMPSGRIPLIVNVGARVRERKARSGVWREFGTFTAGLHDAFTITESAGPNLGVQIDFSAVGARLFYDRPLSELTNLTVELVDVLGRSADDLIARLADAPSWAERFEILDREIAARVARAKPPARAIVCAHDELVRACGRLRIADVVGRSGWSERHLAARFREEIGLAPKAFARTLRFAAAVRGLKAAAAPNLADLAQACGYHDQAHFTREIGEFAGATPTEIVVSRFPNDSGFRA